MHRIDNETATLATPTPSDPGPSPNGYFHHTFLSVDFLNMLQEEICYVIEQAGLTLSKTNQGQLLAAIEQIVTDAGVIPPPVGGGIGSLDLNGYNVVSSTGDITINAGAHNVRLSAGHVLGVGTFGVDGNVLQLPSGTPIQGFFNSASNYLSLGDAWDTFTITQKALHDAMSHFWDNGVTQYIFGACDDLQTTEARIYASFAADSGVETSRAWRAFPFSILNLGGSSLVAMQITAFDVWLESAGTGSSNIQLYIGETTAGAIITGASLNFAAGDTHKALASPSTIGIFDKTNTAHVPMGGFTLLLDAAITRMNYRIAVRSYAI